MFTYDVKWEASTISWDSRWDVYLHGNPDDEIHYFSIVNSLMIVLFLTGVVAMIMLRTLRKDISSYNDMQTLEEAQEESGWKLVHGDVFRPPAFSPMLLSVLSGKCAQMPLWYIAGLCVCLCCCRDGTAAFGDDLCHDLLRSSGASVSREPWLFVDCFTATLRLHGVHRWIHVGSGI